VLQTLITDPTPKYQKLLQKALLKNYLIIDKKKIKHLTQRKQSPPTLNALLKLHEKDIPIRPVINNRTAPTYKVAKFMTTLIRDHITLHNLYNIHNSNQLANDITNLKITNECRMVTFDIKDLYVNMPIKERINIVKEMLHINNDTQTSHQIISLLEIILEQNYFQFQ
jgi:hypothetical protein